MLKRILILSIIFLTPTIIWADNISGLLIAKNKAQSALASGIDSDDLTCTVTNGTGANFPIEYPFNLVIGTEIIKCTDVTGDVLTIERAQESTLAASHAQGDAVRLNITAAYINQFTDKFNSFYTDPITINSLNGDTYISTSDVTVGGKLTALDATNEIVIGSNCDMSSPPDIGTTTQSDAEFEDLTCVSLGVSTATVFDSYVLIKDDLALDPGGAILVRDSAVPPNSYNALNFSLAAQTISFGNADGVINALNFGTGTDGTNMVLDDVGNLDIKGGLTIGTSLQTNASEADLFTTADEINIGSGAGLVNIGSHDIGSSVVHIHGALELHDGISLGTELQSTETAFSLITETVTTLLFGTSATTIEIGYDDAATQTTINGDLIVGDDLTVTGDTIDSLTATANLLATPATLVNIARAAATVNIGKSDGTGVIHLDGQTAIHDTSTGTFLQIDGGTAYTSVMNILNVGNIQSSDNVKGITIGTMTSTGSNKTAYGMTVGAVTGTGNGQAHGISIGEVKSGTSSTTYGIDLAASTTATTTSTKYGIKIGDVSGGGTDNYSLYTGAGKVKHAGGVVILTGLPTSDPGVSGQLYVSGGNLKVSP